MKDASYFDTWTDFISTNKTTIKINRRYSSRSLNNGVFGFGWCTDFEKSLRAPDPESLILKDCKFGTDMVFRISGLRKPAQQGVVYNSENNPSDVIEYKNGVYIRTESDRSAQKFNRGGLLIAYALKAERWIEVIRYTSGLPKKLRAMDGSELNFEAIPKTNKIAKIIGKKTIFEYSYSGSNLTLVRKNKKEIQFFQYDDLQNMTRIEVAGQKPIQILYDEDRDWVANISSGDCFETYKFQSDGIKNHFVSSLERRCRGKANRKAIFEFWYKFRKDGVRYLEKMKVEDNNKIHLLDFNTYTGEAHVIE